MGILSGLSNLGLEKLEKAEIFEDNNRTEGGAAASSSEALKEKSFDENAMLFDKSLECPVCYEKFTQRTVRTGKARVIGQDPDLRPKYDKFEPAKYDVYVCPHCGYAVLTRYFQALPQAQVKLLKENIAGKVSKVNSGPVLSYDDAIQRYQLALASAIVKKAKDSEKAYICLKMAWIIRGKKENLPDETPGYDDIMAELRSDENEALKAAYEGFMSALQKESFPIAGMDETTLNYLLAVLAKRFGNYEYSAKLISKIILNPLASNRIKDRARELKEQIRMELELQKGNS